MKVLATAPNCPKCKSLMILRHKKNDPSSQFWGCSSFPKCNGIVSYNSTYQTTLVTTKKELRRIAKPSSYQSAISDWALNGKGNAIVNAGPGSGKTTLLEHLCLIISEAQPNAEICVCMYNRHIQEAASERGMPALTTHQIGLRAIKAWLKNQGKAFSRDFIDKDKVNNIVMDLVSANWDVEKYLISPVCELVGKLKNTLAPTDNETLSKLCERFTIETNGSFERIAQLARQALEISNKNLYTIDFDDMLYLVHRFKIPVQQVDWLLFDELQDANKAQLSLAMKFVKPSGRFLGVGDRFQSIYGFRGAAPDSMDQAKSSFNAIELPLSITYRCPKSHVRLLNELFPNQPLEAFENNQEGVIDHCSKETMIGRVKDGDLVLSRVNAALVGPCFSLIRQGIKAIIRGRDIGAGLINLIKKFEQRATDIPHLIELLEDYKVNEVAKLLRAKKGTQAESLADRVETVVAISDDCSSIAEMIIKIQEVFSDKKQGVVFSTIHRAKGDEADNVFILRPDLMPHPMASQDWEKQQELNIIWVALSRARVKMTIIGEIPSIPEGEYLEGEYEIIEEKLNTTDQLLEAGEVEAIVEELREEILTVKQLPASVITDCPF